MFDQALNQSNKGEGYENAVFCRYKNHNFKRNSIKLKTDAECNKLNFQHIKKK